MLNLKSEFLKVILFILRHQILSGVHVPAVHVSKKIRSQTGNLLLKYPI